MAERGIKSDRRAEWVFVHAEGLSFKTVLPAEQTRPDLAHKRERWPRPLLRHPGRRRQGRAVPDEERRLHDEEDFGILWKHYEFRNDTFEVRRSRRLAISFFATVGNYDYGF